MKTLTLDQKKDEAKKAIEAVHEHTREPDGSDVSLSKTHAALDFLLDHCAELRALVAADMDEAI